MYNKKMKWLMEYESRAIFMYNNTENYLTGYFFRNSNEDSSSLIIGAGKL